MPRDAVGRHPYLTYSRRIPRFATDAVRISLLYDEATQA